MPLRTGIPMSREVLLRTGALLRTGVNSIRTLTSVELHSYHLEPTSTLTLERKYDLQNIAILWKNRVKTFW